VYIRSIRLNRDSTRHDASNSSDTPCLIIDTMRYVAENCLLTPLNMTQKSDQISLCAATDEQSSLLSKNFSSLLLKTVNGWILPKFQLVNTLSYTQFRSVPENIVSNRGSSHGRSHLLGGPGDGIASQVNLVCSFHGLLTALQRNIGQRKRNRAFFSQTCCDDVISSKGRADKQATCKRCEVSTHCPSSIVGQCNHYPIELHARLHALENEVQRFQNNCQAMKVNPICKQYAC